MSVRIRMKKMGRTHRPYYRICAIDKRAHRDGRALEELGSYDPSVTETDARAVLNKERIAYWLSVGAQPSEKVAVLIKKYGEGGTHVEAQQAALERLAMGKEIADPTGSAALPKPKEEPKPAEAKPEGDGAADDGAEGDVAAATEGADAPASEAEAGEAPAEEAPTEEAKAEEAPAEAPAEEKTEE